MGSIPADSISAANALTERRLVGKVVIITGGASGIGESTAKLFARHGPKVVIADVQDDKGESLCKQLNKINIDDDSSNNNDDNNYDGCCSYVHCDVSIPEEVRRAVDFAVSKHGKLDVMYSNAGITGDLNLDVVGTDNDNFKRVFEVNVFGAFLCAKEAARVMVPERKGVILFTTSVTSLVSGEAPHAYGASKHALVGLMKGLCAELGEYGIRVNSIAPCSIATPLLRNSICRTKSFLDGAIHESGVLKGVVPEPEDIAEAALYLAGDESKYVSGLNMVVDGGYTVTNRSFTTIMAQMIMRTAYTTN